MTDLVVRRLLVDMEQPIERHWCAGDAFRSAFFNALSMSFPVGEQFFIDSVKKGFEALPADKQPAFGDAVRGFVGQEATHRRLHDLYNRQIERIGFPNDWDPRARANLKLMEGIEVRHWLAITAANEHFTAIFADWMLRNPELLGARDKRLATLWLWHSAEESEHRSVAFDLYQALGGNEEWRLRWFRRISMTFTMDTARQTLINLRRDGTLWKFSTWRNAASFLFGKQGLVRHTFKPWLDYRRADFHPHQHDDSASRSWLRDNGEKFVPVGA